MNGGKKRLNSWVMGILVLYFFYSLIGSVSKYNAISSRIGSMRFFLLMGIQLVGIMIFTIGWQFLLKKFNLSFIYLFKGTTVLWGLLLGRVIFKEQITLANLIGAIVIMVGIGVILDE